MQQLKESSTPAKPIVESGEECPVALATNWRIIDGKCLKLSLAIANKSDRDVYVMDRLWTLNEENRRIPDTQPAYVFAVHGLLRLLLGPSPLPRLASVTYKNWPEMTLVKAKQSYAKEFELTLPVREYNAYSSATTDDNSEPVQVETVEVVLHTMAVVASIEVNPSTIDAKAFELTSSQWLGNAQAVRSSPTKFSVAVQRRTDEFSRFFVPGERPDPLKLLR